MGKLTFRVRPSHAAVLVDGDYLKVAEKRKGIRLKPGTHSVTVKADGYNSKTKSVRIRANQTRSLPITLQRRAPQVTPPAPKPVQVVGTGSIHIFAKPYANIFIDGKRIGLSPTKTPLVLPAGSHLLELKRQGFKTYHELVTIQPNQTLRRRISMEKIQ